MKAADKVAIVALVVALVALAVAFLQAGEQLFGTAEGYRKCGKQTIGHWHRLRWRHWVWTEFRFETHFITPKVVLGPPPDEETKGQKCLRLAGKDPRQPSARYKKWFFRLHDRDDAALEAPAVLSKSIQPWPAENVSVRMLPHPSANGELGGEETGQIANKAASTYTKASPGQKLFRSQNKASWIVLLQSLYQAYSASFAQSSKSEKPFETVLKLPDWHQKPSGQYQRPTTLGRDDDNTVKTEASIIFQEWVWELLPSDVTKPLATTTLGALINFALRMGLHWQKLGDRDYELLASGNGLNLSFIEMNGLGLVASFRRSGRESTAPKLIPGRATDKLMFGILPGCKDLGGDDIHCIGKQLGKIDLPALQVSDSVWSSVCQKLFPRNYEIYADATLDTRNEGVTLLCEYLPVEDSTAHTYFFWGWRGYMKRCCFTWYEGCFAFMRHLRMRNDVDGISGDLVHVLYFMDYLEKHYPMDFYALHEKKALDANDTSVGDLAREKSMKQLCFQKDCRNIFKWTTKWFKDRGYDCPPHSDDAEQQTVYAYLVAAHCRMSYLVAPEANARLKRMREKARNDPRGRGWCREFKHEEYNLDDERYGIPVKYNAFGAAVYELAAEYTQKYDDPKIGILKYMRHRDVNKTDEELRTAWWILMLRGVIWHLSTWHHRDAPGAAVPSAYYDNHTPVWIT